MKQKDATYLLFIQHFGNGPLFKNQTELAIELINEPSSSYYEPRSNIGNYNKAVSRLKAYLSQLFSDSARRNVTNEFQQSLEKVLNKKNNPTIDVNLVVNDIIADLREKNNKFKNENIHHYSKRDNEIYFDFLQKIVDARYIAIFTAREIRFEYEGVGQKLSLVDFLIKDLLDSLKEEKGYKYYRFNFPLEQTCQLFWRGLRKEVSKFLKKEFLTLGTLMAISKYQNWFNFDQKLIKNANTDDIEKFFSSILLEYFSKNNIINVFHLKQPVYLVPTIAINPNGGQEQNTYLLLQSSLSEESLHRFTNEEFIFWKLFVWDNLKRHKQGVSIMYSAEY